jgi:hypothetical protein
MTKQVYDVIGLVFLLSIMSLAQVDEARPIAMCSGTQGLHGAASERSDPATVPTLPLLKPLVTTTELLVGSNRFAFGLARAGQLLERAAVVVHLYAMEGTSTFLTAEVPARYYPVTYSQPKSSRHMHADGSSHEHDAGSEVRGLYVAQLHMARAGEWGVELCVRQEDGTDERVRLAVTVQETTPTPAIGSPSPRSRNLIASDVHTLRQIDTSPEPDPRLHQVRIADAIAQGRPQLIVFATPQFCLSRMCAPVVEVVRTLLPVYSQQVVFTHQEIWQDFATQRVFPTVEEWRLRTEPWVFLVDGRGIIHARFEGLVSPQELDVALRQMLSVPQREHR